MTAVQGFAAYENIAVAVINPRPVTRTVIPPGLPAEFLAELEREIDRINAELETSEPV